MKPALRAFLKKVQDQFVHIDYKGFKEGEILYPLEKLCDGFTNLEPSEVKEADVKEFINAFYKIKKTLEGKTLKADPAQQIQDEVIFPLELLLHERDDPKAQEIKMSSLMDHFGPFLGCPFQIKHVNDQIQFVLFYEDAETVLGKKQRFNGVRFSNVLTNLGIVDKRGKYKENNNRAVFTVAHDQVKNLLRFAQFDLISEDNAPKKVDDLQKKLRFILTELIETEVSFSKSAENLAKLLEAKIKAFDEKTDPLIKITQEDREFLAKAAGYYREIGNNRYPWFGSDVDAESLKNKSLEDMLRLCNSWYERLQQDKDEALSKRLGCLRWITVNYSRLDRLVNPQRGEESLLHLSDNIIVKEEKLRQSEKSVGSQNLITPVQRLPRILLLTGELKNCIAGFPKAGTFNELLDSSLCCLNGLLSEWLREVKKTNHEAGVKEAANNASPVQKILGALEQFIDSSRVDAVDLGATFMAGSIRGHLTSLPPLSAFRSRADKSTASDLSASSASSSTSSTSTTTTATLSASSATQSMSTESDNFEALPGFDEALTRTVLFAGQETHAYYERPLARFYNVVTVNILVKLINIESQLSGDSVEVLKEYLNLSYETINNSRDTTIRKHIDAIINSTEAIPEPNDPDSKAKLDSFKKEEITALRWLISEKYFVQPIENSDNPELEKRLKGLFGEDIDIQFPPEASGKLGLVYQALDEGVSAANADRIEKILTIFSIPFQESIADKTIFIAAKDLEAVYQLMHFVVKSNVPASEVSVENEKQEREKQQPQVHQRQQQLQKQQEQQEQQEQQVQQMGLQVQRVQQMALQAQQLDQQVQQIAQQQQSLPTPVINSGNGESGSGGSSSSVPDVAPIVPTSTPIVPTSTPVSINNTPIQAQRTPTEGVKRITESHSEQPSSLSKFLNTVLFVGGIAVGIAGILFLVFMPHILLFLGIGAGIAGFGVILGSIGGVRLLRNDNPVTQLQDGSGARAGVTEPPGEPRNDSAPVFRSGDEPVKGAENTDTKSSVDAKRMGNRLDT